MATEIPRTDDGNFKCPTCGTAETLRGKPFSTRGGIRSHHKQVHGESIAYKTVECANCGDECKASIASESSTHYCSKECNDATAPPLTVDRY